MSAPVTARIDWRGVVISILYHQRRWDSAFDHVEVRVIGNGDIPITETGYRSHFVANGIVDQFGGAEAYVLAWLDFEADTPQWKARAEAARQFSLF